MTSDIDKLMDAYERCAELADDMRNERDAAIQLLLDFEPFVQEYLLCNPDKKELLDQLKTIDRL